MEDIWRDEGFWQEVESDLTLATAAVSRRAILQGTREAEAAGVLVDFDQVHREALHIVRTTESRYWKAMTQTTRDGLREALQTWQELGLGRRGLPDLIDSIEPLFGPDRAKRIAVTEGTRLLAEGNKLAAREDPNVGGMRWQTVGDERACAICVPRNNRVWPEPEAPECPAHVSCRCRLSPVSWDYVRGHQTEWQGGELPGEERFIEGNVEENTQRWVEADDLDDVDVANRLIAEKESAVADGVLGDSNVMAEAERTAAEQIAEEEAAFGTLWRRAPIDVRQRVGQETRSIVRQWNMGSYGRGEMALQEAARRQFQLPTMMGQHVSSEALQLGIEEYAARTHLYNSVIDNAYRNVQTELTRAGLNQLELYRGISYAKPPNELLGMAVGETKRIRTTLQPMSSFSAQRKTADGFARSFETHGYVLQAQVPVDRVIGTPRSGFGFPFEREVVVLGGDIDVTIRRVR